MKQNKFIIAAIISVCSFGVLAKTDDLKQEVKISAASQTGDIKNNLIIFYGPVEVTQGSIKIHADELRAHSSDIDGSKTFVAKGRPASFSQILDDGRPASASANEIRYELNSRTLTLIGNAKLDQSGSAVTGNRIQYNIEKQQLIAESSGKGNDRVITIIQPENYQEELNIDDKPAKQPEGK